MLKYLLKDFNMICKYNKSKLNKIAQKNQKIMLNLSFNV